MSATGKGTPARKTMQAGLRLALAVIWLWLVNPAAAQSGGRVILLPPDTTRFPIVSFSFEAYNNQGEFITGLDKSAIEIVENDLARPVSEMSQQQPGLQITVALNTGPTLAYTYANVSRIEQVRRTLTSWLVGQPSNTPDDFSFLTGTGSLGTHVTNPQQVAQAVSGYAPDLLKTQPTLAGLTQALDLATDPLRRPLMKRAIVFITPLLPDTALQALPNLADRANQLGVRVFVWLILPNPTGETKMTQALKDLAAHTNGHYFVFAGTEPFPNLETALQPLRYYYRVTYNSAIKQSGNQRVSLRLKTAAGSITGNEQSFKLTVLPPNPMFLDPPARVTRSWEEVAGQGKTVLQPPSASFKMLVEFPDGFTRPLKAARLFVDGALASEQTSAPFDRFEWLLDPYINSGRHRLQLEVEDTLGLIQTSIITNVDLTIPPRPQAGLLQQVVSSPYLITAAFLVGLLGVTAIGFVVFRRIKRQKAKNGSITRPRPRAVKEHLPTAASQSSRRHPTSVNAPARLMHLSENGRVLPGSAIPISAPEITLGSDIHKAQFVIDSPCVDGLHARLKIAQDGQFILFDAGSVAGTWVNYAAVPEQGVALCHGDTVHIGREVFQFELNHPAPPRIPLVTPLKGEYDSN